MITGYYDPGRLQHAGSQGIDLSCHVPISFFVAIHNVTDRQADGQTDGRHVRSISAVCRAKNES